MSEFKQKLKRGLRRWDSSDPERAPPPLPMNPRSMSPSMSPTTRSHVSPGIQAVAAKFTEKSSDNAPSSYTTNPMPPKSSSPERSLIKGQHHKRMQSLQPEDTRQDARSEFMTYLENRSPERPLRATIVEGTKQRDPSKSTSSPSLRQDAEKDVTYSLSSRYLSKPILGESTPPSATMLALQNMQLPMEPDPPSPSKPPKMITAPFEPRPAPIQNTSMDSLASQIHSLTDIASSLQREMMNLSRRSKDNATDLVSLKAATNARDEDIRKSLKELSSHLTTKYLDTETSRFDFSNLFKGGDGPNPKDPDSPVSKRSYSVPRMPSPNPFAFDRDSCVSPAPISDGSAALALLEKVLREMATKEGEERLLELVEELKSRPAATASDKEADTKVTAMLEEILNLVKEDPASKALVRSYGIANNLNAPEPDDETEPTRSRSVDPETVRALDLSKSDKGDMISPNSEEVLAVLTSVKNSVVESGGMTNGVKSLVRELRGEVLGMGRELGRRLDDIETTRANDETDDKPRAAGPEEISAIVNRSLDDLKEQLAATINESRQQSSDLAEFRANMNSAAVYSVVKKALDELELPQPQSEPRGAEMDRDDILETVREAWETYKPEIEFNNFGLERDEILTCLEEGLKSYQPQHEEAVTYDQVLAAVEDGMQKFNPPTIEAPPGISRDEIILVIRECLDKQADSAPRSLDEEHVGHLNSMRDEILEAVAKTMATHHEGAKVIDDEHINHLYGVRDEIMDTLNEKLATTNGDKSVDEEHITHLHSVRDEIIEAVTSAMAAHAATPKSPEDDPTATHLTSLRDEILQAVAGAMATNDTGSKELSDEHVNHLYAVRDEIMEAVTGTMAAQSTSKSVDEDHIAHLNSIRDEILGAVAGSVAQSTLSNDSGLGRDEIVSAVSDSLEAHFTAAKEMDEPNISRHDVMNAVNEAFDAQQTALSANSGNSSVSRDEILNAIAEGIETSMHAHNSALVTNEPQTLSREEILGAIVDGIEQSRSSPSTDEKLSRDDVLSAILEGLEQSPSRTEPSISRDEILSAIADGIENSQSNSRSLAVTEHEHEDEKPSISREEILSAIVEGIEHSRASLSEASQPSISKEEIMSAIAEGIETSQTSQQSALSTNVQEPTISRDEILSAISEGIQNGNSVAREIELNQDDLMEAITNGLNEAIGATNFQIGGDVTERLQTLVDDMKEEFKQYSSANGRDTEQVLDAVKDGIDVVRKEIETYVATTADLSGKDEVIDTVKEGFRLLHADMEKTITDSALANGSRGAPDTPELLDAMEKEFEHLRGTITTLLLRESAPGDKDEILDAIREVSENTKTPSGNEGVIDSIKQEFESLRERMDMSLVSSQPGAEKDEIISTLREHFDNLREETAKREENNSSPAELLDAVTGGVDSIREDLKKLLEKPAEFDSTEILETIKDGLADLKLEMESLRQSNKEADEAGSTRGGELMLANEAPSSESEPPTIVPDIDGLKALITQLHDKVESTPRSVEPDEDALKRSHLDEVLAALHTVHEKVESAPRSAEPDEDTLKRSHLEDVLLALSKVQEKVDIIESTPRSAEPDEDTLKRSHLDDVLAALQSVHEKVEIIESTPRSIEPDEDALKRSHLDEVLLAIHELQLAVGEMSAKPGEDDTTVKKEDTEALEQLILSTKAQIEELVFPAPDNVATPEHIGTLETMIREAKESIAEFSGRMEAEAPTKAEIGTLEGLIKDVWVVLEELKSSVKETEQEDPAEKILKSDLQTVEAMIFEVKTQVDELKLPDVDTLPTKTDIEDLSGLVNDFREKMEANNELTAQGFDARKVEHGGLAEKIDEAKFVVGELGDELKSKLDGSTEGLAELKQLLEGLAITAESFSTVDNIKEVTDLINREFERSRGEEDAGKIEKEERDAAAMVKHDETRAAIIVELGTKIDEKISEVLAKYEDAHTSLHSKFTESEERDVTHTESLASTKSLAEDIRLVIGSMGDSVNETCERLSVDTKALIEQVDQSRQQLEEMHNDVKSHKEQSQAETERAAATAAATDRVESKLLEFHPQILESVQEILNIVNQHYDHSQRSAEDFKSELSALPANIPAMLPAVPAQEPESERMLAIEDTPLSTKLDDILEHARNSQVHEILSTLLDHSKDTKVHDTLTTLAENSKNDQIHETLNTLVENSKNDQVHEILSTLLEHSQNTQVHDSLNDMAGKHDQIHESLATLLENSKNDQLHEKLDRALEQGSGSNDQIYEKLNELLDHATSGTGPIHEKLDALLSRPENPPESDNSTSQMMKLDEMHRDIMENSRKMNEMFAAQSVLVAEDTERKRREAEEAAIALERRVAQREQVEAELVGLHEEKDSMLNMIHRLNAEKEEMIRQNNRLTKDLSGLETALEIRHEEMRQMEDRADGLEKRILEGVLDHARTVLLSRSNSLQAMNLKRNRSTRSTRSSRAGARSPSSASSASTAKESKDNRSLLGSGVGMALKRRIPNSLHAGTTAVQPNIGKERRILSLSHVTGNRGADRQVSGKSGIANLKRSHSVKSNTLRKASWAGPTSVADKENEPFHEEDELASDTERDAGPRRHTSHAGSDRRTSYAGSVTPSDRKTSFAESNTPSERKTSYAGSEAGTERKYAESNADSERRTSYTGSNAGTERRTSYAGTCVDSIAESVVTDDFDPRRVSGVSSKNDHHVAESSIAEDDHEDREDDISIDGSDSGDDARTAQGDTEHAGAEEHENDEDHELSRQIREANEAAEAEVMKLLSPTADSGLGTDVAA
ncbi:hypothetical protein N7541_001271 [Penicillium brevicompactum]|uniref:L27 domain-containing protein n=1 Tax=Penicillium brevicompactum TaxID=5074 RepID=A0A9W9V5M6_PENBR|nr:hypothetical protein N7541_001271 [Penicillium brevicompactum]